MARPQKIGLDYFPFDVDFFGDDKIIAASVSFGVKGELTAVKLLCAIYRNGYFVEWSDSLRLKLLRELPGVSENLLKEIMNGFAKWGFIDKELFDTSAIITSRGIQERYFASKRRTPTKDDPWIVIAAKTPVIAAKTPVIAAKTPQSKVNKRKIFSDENNAREDDADFLKQFFAPERAASLEVLLMDLGLPSDGGLQQLRTLAAKCVAEWQQTDKQHDDYTDFSRHLISQLRIKVRATARSRQAAVQADQYTAQAEAVRREQRERELRQQRDRELHPPVSRSEYKRKHSIHNTLDEIVTEVKQTKTSKS